MVTPARNRRKPIDYPTSDGKPFAESDWHFRLASGLIGELRERYRADPMVYVSGNLLVYYEEGNVRKRVAPDVFVVFGAEKKLRRYYLTWEEKQEISIVIETTSAKTRREDMNKKLPIFRDVLRVQEVFFFDLFAEYLNPRLQGYRLDTGGQYTPIPISGGRLYSERLGLWLEPSGLQLLLIDPAEPELRRSAQVEADFLELLRFMGDLRRENDKLTWRKEK